MHFTGKDFDLPVNISALKDFQLNAISENDYFVYAGFSDGILRIDKDQLNQLPKIDLHLNTPKLFNRYIKSERSVFRPSENSLSFSFHSTSYYQINKVIFQYRLLGLDSSWQETKQSKVNYFNLNPGDYTFQVRSGYSHHHTFSNKKEFSFQIEEPFWKKSWFIIITLLLFFLMITAGFRLREKRIVQLGKRQEEKMKFELQQLKNQIDPHFLFNSFNSLIGLIEENQSKQYVQYKNFQIFIEVYWESMILT